jgi:hypothetical protein
MKRAARAVAGVFTSRVGLLFAWDAAMMQLNTGRREFDR